MAIKKNELYSSLWASCDKLRGGMDASQYKDYILTLLFVKYVTDKYKGVRYADITVPEGGSFDDLAALKGDKNIGEKMDKVIAKLAEADGNNLRGVIDNAHFNDETKLGKGQEMVDKLTGLIAIFQRPEFNFKNNKASGDDILGDAYEYLMRNFATESGKSKGQFYTPAEVSRVLAKIIGIDRITDPDTTVYDPACGSGSLLIKAADEAPFEVAIHGQEKEITTAGLAKMNLVLHNRATGVIATGNTFSDPQYFEPNSNNQVLRRFDFIVVNPPFSLKNWTDGVKDYGRFSTRIGRPPERNGDFAWLLHVLKSLKSTGRAAVILPRGVLFRGYAEESIRRGIIDRGFIKGIIGLPPNLFYGTGIPACILVIDKSDADKREGIFMIDASRDFVKDGNKNRLRERDIYKIVTTFNQQIRDDPTYARFVPNHEIKVMNDYDLNLSRYIDSAGSEDVQDIGGHLHGGIPDADVASVEQYWAMFPELRRRLFSPLGEGYWTLNLPKEEVRGAVCEDEAFSAYAGRIRGAFHAWKEAVDPGLRGIDESVNAKRFIAELAERLIAEFEPLELLDKYDVYEALLSYWQETMADDVFILKYDGYGAGQEWENIVEYKENKKGERKETLKGWEGKLIPKAILERVYFSSERAEIDRVQRALDEAQARLDELTEDQTGEGGFLLDHLNDRDRVDVKSVAARLRHLEQTQPDGEECQVLRQYIGLAAQVKERAKTVRKLSAALEALLKEKYGLLTLDEVKDLLVEEKWCRSVFAGIEALYDAVSRSMADRVAELAERYEAPLSRLEQDAEACRDRVKAHLERMGYAW